MAEAAPSSNGQVVFSGNDGDDVNVAFVGMESLLEKGRTVHGRNSSCRTRRTSLEIFLFIFSVVSFLAAVCLIIVLALRSSNDELQQNSHAALKTIPKEGICVEPECVQAASRLIEFSNFHVDPCQDFFEYACGTWNKRHVIPPDDAVFNTFSSHKDAVSVKLKDLLENVRSDANISAIKKAKDYYRACTSESGIDDLDIGPINNVIAELGGWPVVDGPGWRESTFDLEDFIINLALRQTWILIHQFVNADDKRSNVNIIQLDQTKLGLRSRNYYLLPRNGNRLTVYEEYATNIAVAFGADSERAKREMKEMVDFEVILAKITTPPEERLNNTAMYNKMTIRQLQAEVTGFRWSRYLKIMFDRVGVTIDDDEEVVVYAMEYFHKMVTLLDETDKRILANYGIWRLVMSQIENLPKRYRDIGKKYRAVFCGTTSDKDRWRTCVEFVSSRLGDAIGRMFVKEHFDEANRDNALDMIHHIRTAFYELIEEVPWMDDSTKVVAKEKAEKIQEKIGYPEYILNDTALNLEYKDIEIDSKRHFDNNMKCLQRETHRSLSQLGKPVDRTVWLKPPTVINAYYHSSSNQIMLPAGILQPPFYSKGYPKSVNFGGIGMVIGHEITHGFDDKGRQYDKDGNMVQWWPDDVIRKFTAQAQCIVDQYSNFTIKSIGKNLNGILTRGENIADNGGLKESHRAYRNWVERNNGGVEEKRLPGLLNFTHDQLFFLNFAQVWCGTMTKVAAQDYIRTKIHSPGQFRVEGTLQNSYAFAKAYNCPHNSPMNPAKKCAVW